MLKALGLIALVAASAPAPCQVYKTTDPSGKVQYSDKPPPGTAVAPSKYDAASAFRELQGTWSVANATMNGALYDDPKIAGSTWTFRDNELLLEPRVNSEKVRYTLKFDLGASPKAFFATPVQPSGARGGWMIYARDGMRLRIAFMENMEGRPTGFERQPKRVGVVLVAQEAAQGKGMAAGDEPRACKILRAAGVMDLLGPTAAPSTVHQSATHCRFEQPMGSATLGMRLDTTRSALDREREQQHKQALASAARIIVRDEPELGPSAFSVTRGNRLTVYLLKGETIFVIDLELPAGSQTNRTTFVRRVIAAI